LRESPSRALLSKHRRILFAIAVMLVTLLLHTVFAMLDTSACTFTHSFSL
jgi:hypothetical protein